MQVGDIMKSVSLLTFKEEDKTIEATAQCDVVLSVLMTCDRMWSCDVVLSVLMMWCGVM